MRKLERFHFQCISRILRRGRCPEFYDGNREADLLHESGIPSIGWLIKERRLMFLAHSYKNGNRLTVETLQEEEGSASVAPRKKIKRLPKKRRRKALAVGRAAAERRVTGRPYG